MKKFQEWKTLKNQILHNNKNTKYLQKQIQWTPINKWINTSKTLFYWKWHIQLTSPILFIFVIKKTLFKAVILEKRKVWTDWVPTNPSFQVFYTVSSKVKMKGNLKSKCSYPNPAQSQFVSFFSAYHIQKRPKKRQNWYVYIISTTKYLLMGLVEIISWFWCAYLELAATVNKARHWS